MTKNLSLGAKRRFFVSFGLAQDRLLRSLRMTDWEAITQNDRLGGGGSVRMTDLEAVAQNDRLGWGGAKVRIGRFSASGGKTSGFAANSATQKKGRRNPQQKRRIHIGYAA